MERKTTISATFCSRPPPPRRNTTTTAAMEEEEVVVKAVGRGSK